MEESNEKVNSQEDQAEKEGEQIDGNDIAEKGKEESEDKTSEGEAKENEPNDEAKKKQSRERNSFYAEQRRKAREERERKETEARIRKQVEFDVKKENVTKDELKSLGLDKIETDEDLFLVESYRKAKSEGAENPEHKAYLSLRSKQSAEAKEAEEKRLKDEENLKSIAKEQEEVKKKYGKSCKDILEGEPDFKEFLDTFGNGKTFIECYEYFKSNVSKADKEEREKSKHQATPPTSNSGSSDNTSKGGAETDEQFKARWIREHGRW